MAAKVWAPSLTKRELPYEREPDAALELLGGRLPPSVWPTNPFRLNERLTIQKGLFLAPGDVTRSFSENLAGLRGHDSPAHVTCFVMPPSAIDDISRDLYEANVTEATLFPGLDGFAKLFFVYGRHLPLDGFAWENLKVNGRALGQAPGV